MRLAHSTLALLATTLLLSSTTSLAAPILGRHNLYGPAEVADRPQDLQKRWSPGPSASSAPAFLRHDGHAIFDDDDDDAGNEMLDTEEGLLRPDADDEVEGTIEGQVLEIEDDDELELNDSGPLADADLDAINRAFLDKDDIVYQQHVAPNPSPIVVTRSEQPSRPVAPVRPVVLARFDGARTRSRALK